MPNKSRCNHFQRRDFHLQKINHHQYKKHQYNSIPDIKTGTIFMVNMEKITINIK